jgi:hypothetical protein
MPLIQLSRGRDASGRAYSITFFWILTFALTLVTPQSYTRVTFSVRVLSLELGVSFALWDEILIT